MYFTNGSSRAFEMLMRGKPGFDRYENGGCADCEDCNTCHFYRPHWKYQFCVYAECPYEPLEQVKAAGLRVDRENYELVYTAPLSDTDTLENIFVRFNMDRPQDFTGHSLSMSRPRSVCLPMPWCCPAWRAAR